MKTVVVLLTLFSLNAKAENFDQKMVVSNAFSLIKKVVPDSHPEFLPGSEKDITLGRFERSGVIDFIYTSKNGKFRGNIYCHLSQLMKYNDKYSNTNDTCFRANIHEFDKQAINGFGKQVGIY